MSAPDQTPPSLDRASFDWASFELDLPLRADPATVLTCIETAEGFLRWFHGVIRVKTATGEPRSNDQRLRVGDRIEWCPYPGDAPELAEVIEVASDRVVVFFDSDFVRVTFRVVEIAPSDKIPVTAQSLRSRFVLTQSGMPTTPRAQATWHVSCRAGWTYYLANLRAVLDFSCDLRGTGSEYRFEPGRIGE